MVERFLTSQEDKGLRLDQYLQQQSPDLSRTKIRKIIDIGGVHVDGRRARKCGKIICPGQAIQLHQDESSLSPYRIVPDDILFEDQYIIVLNKPAGINTQPTPARYKGTLYEALQTHLQRDNRLRKVEIGMAQRLDRDTSGVIVFSIHPQSHKGLTDQLQNRSLQKKYLALVTGNPSPQQGTFHSYLLRDRNSHLMRSVPEETKGVKEAITHYTVVKSWADSSLVEVQLVTGRTHQVRVHFAEAGHPLLGDTAYGGPEFHEGARWKRQCLHSYRLQLSHPKTGKTLSITAPVPGDMGPAKMY